MSQEDDSSLPGGPGTDGTGEIMAAFRSSLARMDADPAEAARIRVLADRTDTENEDDMSDRINHDRLPVFLSFAGQDRPKAERLRRDLAALGFDAFVDAPGIPPGEDRLSAINLLSAINKALTRSSYCVLLWSRHTQDRPWVDLEWAAALSHDLNEKRSFLFVVRLDETEVPLLLATRKYLDASVDWEAAVARLVATWRRDREVGTPVFPAPGRVAAGRSGDVHPIELYVRNQALSVSHMVAVPSTATSSELLGLVRRALDLPDSESKYKGIVSIRFEYELRYRDTALPDGPLTDLGIDDGDTVDLVVHGEFVSNGEPVSTWTFRDGPALQRALIDAAFGHLMPLASRIHRKPAWSSRGVAV